MTAAAPALPVVADRSQAPARAPTPLHNDELARRAKAGDDSAWDELYRRFAPKLDRHLSRFIADPHDREDVLADVLLKAWLHLPRTSADLRVGPWLYRIAANAAIDRARHRWGSVHGVRETPFAQVFRRARARGHALTGSEHADVGDPAALACELLAYRRGLAGGATGLGWSADLAGGPCPEQACLDAELAAELRAVLRAALRTLPADYRLALALREWHGLPYREIAAELGVTVAAAKSRLWRARTALRAWWERRAAP